VNHDKLEYNKDKGSEKDASEGNQIGGALCKVDLEEEDEPKYDPCHGENDKCYGDIFQYRNNFADMECLIFLMIKLIDIDYGDE
jgi:hypothetical protein